MWSAEGAVWHIVVLTVFPFALFLRLQSYVTMHESRQDQIEEDCKGDQRLFFQEEVIPKQGLKA